MTYEEIKKELKDLWKHLQSIQQDRANRNSFLDLLAEERAEQQNIKYKSTIKQIKNTEVYQVTHNKLNYHLKDNSKGAIEYLLIPDGDDPKGPFGKKWRKIMDTKEVKAQVLRCNEAKLKESRISPFSIITRTLYNKFLTIHMS